MCNFFRLVEGRRTKYGHIRIQGYEASTFLGQRGPSPIR